MRVILGAAIAALALVSAASAETWTDPAGRVIVDAPRGWSVLDQRTPNLTYVIIGTANDECHILAIPRAESAAMSPAAIKRATANDANYTPEAWGRVSAGMTSVFSAPPTIVSRSQDNSQFWPIQRAELQGERLVHGAIQLRPGIELQTYCQSYEGTTPTETFETVIHSVRTANDAALQQQAEAEAPAAPAQN